MIDQQVMLAHEEQRNRTKNMAKRMIWTTFQKEGIHCYPQAMNDPKLKTGDDYDVSFLAWPHRHMFGFKVGIQVFHNDRDLEFIQVKRWLENQYTNGILELNHKSCEMIADELYEIIATRYPNRDITISVSEDGENGCEIFYHNERKQSSIAILG
jgi:hypothetical protein